MAKVIFSALVESMSGSHGKNGTVSSSWKGVQVLKRHPTPRQPRTAMQQQIRGLMNDLSGNWYTLSDVQHDLWNKYASLLNGPLTGMNAYQRLNLNLARYLGVAEIIAAPPPTPATPDSPTGHSMTATDDTTNTLTWTAPSGNSDYLIMEFSFLAALDDRAHPRWSFAAGVSPSALTLAHTHAYPTGTIMSYRARVMDQYGRVSPYTERMDVTVPSP